MLADVVPEQHRKGVEELLELLYADTPLEKIEKRACTLARSAIGAECLFLARAIGGEPQIVGEDCTEGTPRPPDIEILLGRAIRQGERVFENGKPARVAVPIKHGGEVLGALAATDSRRPEFSSYDADVLEVYAQYVAIAQSNAAKIGRWMRHLHRQRRAMLALPAAALLITIALAVYALFDARVARAHLLAAARQAAFVSADHVERFVASAAQLASTAAALAPEFRGNRPATERLLRTLLESAPPDAVYGVGVWYQPHAFSPRVRLFGPYVHRTDHRIVLTYSWSTAPYDYPTHAWYRTGENAGASTLITSPYFDVDHVYISAVHQIRANGKLIGVASVDLTSERLDTFLRHISSAGHFSYLATRDGHVVAFPEAQALLAFAKTRHPVRRILDVTTADADSFIRLHYPRDRIVLSTPLPRTPLMLTDSWNPAALGTARVPVPFIIGVAVLIWVLTVVALVEMRRGGANTRQVLDVDRERARLLMEIDARAKAEQALRNAAESDHLTGLADRSSLLRAIDEAIKRRRGGDSISSGLLLLDLNGLESINQRCGHLAGDEILVQAASLIRRCCAENDVPARLGSDEFAVLLRGAAHERAHTLAECVQRGLSSGIRLSENTVFIEAAAGFAEIGDEHATAVDVVRDADYAITHAKRRGKAITDFTQELRVAANRERELQAALRAAIARGELRVAYQPIYRLSNRIMTGIEALARWRRGDQNVPPSEFIPLAERTGLVVEIDRYVAETAMRRMRPLQAAANLRLSLNVSALHFKSPETFEALQSTLAKHGPSQAVDIELTETALLSLSDESVELVARLRENGVGMHLDDFGTGYSSLAYLQRLQVDALKVDQSFVMAMLQDERAMQIVDAIVQLTRRLHLYTIFEGIESEVQERVLRDLGATMGQGNLYAKPMSAEALESLLQPV